MNIPRFKTAKSLKKAAQTTSTENLDDEESSQEKLIKGLRSANSQLTEDNRKKTILLGQKMKEIHDNINMINKLTLELQWWKNRSNECTVAVKALHAKYVMLSEDFVNIVVQSTMPGHFDVEYLVPKETPVDRSVSFNTPNVQQTRAVKPMISGHTIHNPVINLPRVSPEQLERLSNQVRLGTTEELPETEEDENVDDYANENENLEEIAQDDEAEEVQNEENGDLSEPEANISPEEIDSTNYAQTNARLDIIMEETGTDTLIDATIPQTRSVVSNSNSLSTIAPQVPSTSRADPSTSQSSLVLEDSLLTDISNTVSQGHVTVSRGRPRKRPNVTFVPEADDTAPDETIEATLNVELSNTVFVTGLGASTSTPANEVPVVKRQRTRRRISGVENHNDGDSLARLGGSQMKRCSVVLKRIAAPKRKSLSPRKSPIETDTLATTCNTNLNSMSPSTLENLSSPKGRPKRKAKPTNLKEKNLKGKMRRKADASTKRR
ncbi:uncharacterized protein [Atheta coriaria]|uniref:uncharacterized protein isoform X2 n=1 Tax=Dalotia coriaria TaxID=877792 RepID=UPI0031F3DE24